MGEREMRHPGAQVGISSFAQTRILARRTWTDSIRAEIDFLLYFVNELGHRLNYMQNQF